MTVLAAPRAPAPVATTDRPVLTARGLVRRFPGDVGVLGVDLTVAPRQVLGLVGPNGAGKTTLISMLCGMIRPDEGSVDIAGRLAVCPDTPEFEPWLTAAEVLRQSFTLARPGDHLDEARVAHVLADTGVAEYADRRVGGFSRGMTQRLGIAAALVVDPDLLVLDEPTSALDPNGRADVLELIRATGRERSVVLSSHALADVQRTTDRIAVMDAGRVLFDGAPRELIDEHLRPRWRVSLGTDTAQALAADLAGQDWVHTARARSPRELDVEARTLELGEQHLVPTLARSGARVLAMTPLDADLESAFLALTGRPHKEET